MHEVTTSYLTKYDSDFAHVILKEPHSYYTYVTAVPQGSST